MRILLCDDHGALVESLRLLLQARGHHVRCTIDPSEVLLAVLSGDVDTCLVDLHLELDSRSHASGAALVRRISAVAPSCRVVVITGSSDPADRRRALGAGADAFVVKGTDVAGVLRAIEDAPLVTLGTGTTG